MEQEQVQADSPPLGQVSEEQIEGPPFPYWNRVTVKVSEAIGIIAMSIMALILLIELLRAQAHIRELQQKLSLRSAR